MGRKLRQDKIGALSHNAGVITLAPSIVSVARQQYQTSSLEVALPTFEAGDECKLYFIYMNSSAQLVITESVPSVQGSNFTLVGAFYSDGITGSIGFGSFVNIEGSPEALNIPITISWSNLTVGNGTEIWSFSRKGGSVYIMGGLVWGSTTSISGTVGIGNPIPNTTPYAMVAGGTSLAVPGGFARDVSASVENEVIYINIAESGYGLLANNGADFIVATTPFTWTTSDRLSLDIRADIQEWSNVPLKDL